MTSDVARLDDNAAVALNHADDALERLGRWVTAAAHANQLVAPLVDTPFVPDAYRPKTDPRATAEQQAAAREVAVANATAAVLQGISLGLDPLTALQQIYIVSGRPGMYAEAMVALVMAAGHEMWTEDLSDSRAVVGGRRAGNDQIERVTITMDQARKAGWTRNQAYAKTPQDMLYARAAGRVARRIAPDVLLGIASVEEIQDTIQTGDTSATRTVRPRRQRKALQAANGAAAEQPKGDRLHGTDDDLLDPEPMPINGEEISQNDQASAITPKQLRKLQSIFTEHKIGRDLRLAISSKIINRDINSARELTLPEAGVLIDTLERLAEADDFAGALQELIDATDDDDAEPTGGDAEPVQATLTNTDQ